MTLLKILAFIVGFLFGACACGVLSVYVWSEILHMGRGGIANVVSSAALGGRLAIGIAAFKLVKKLSSARHHKTAGAEDVGSPG